MSTHNERSERFDFVAQERQPTQQANEAPNPTQQNGVVEAAAANPRFGHIRDRLFQAMLVRLSIPYHQSVPLNLRRFFEFLTLINALGLLSILVYMHFLVRTYPGQCLESIGHDDWPRKGIVRIEAIPDLAELREQSHKKHEILSNQFCHYNLAQILRTGNLPIEMQNSQKYPSVLFAGNHEDRIRFERPFPVFWDFILWFGRKFNFGWNQQEEEWEVSGQEENDDRVYHHLMEFSPHYGLLKLSPKMRQELNVEIMQIQLDPEHDSCFKEWRERFLMRYLIGIDEVMLSSVKHLFENDTEKGYLHDLTNAELYHFVSVGPSSSSTYLTALIVMLVFTFAISMLLRFSHDQIFVFIVELFQMFEQNQPLMFPLAPLLTVILALVGMEAIMSEIFNDTTTAFYVIILVWMADQYDAIFCHSPIGRRHWLRFFYLYHFAFYAYHYRYNGRYSGLALLTSTAFIFHSMVFFFQHFELPYIIRQERLNDLINHIQNDPDAIPRDGRIENLEDQHLVAEATGQTQIVRTRMHAMANWTLERIMAMMGQRQRQEAMNPQNDNNTEGNNNINRNPGPEEQVGGRVAAEIVAETIAEIGTMTMDPNA